MPQIIQKHFLPPSHTAHPQAECPVGGWCPPGRVGGGAFGYSGEEERITFPTETLQEEQAVVASALQ